MKTKVTLVAIFVCLCVCKFVQGNEKDGFSTADEKITDWKHPADWLELGADLRLRVDYDNSRKLDKDATGHDRVVFPRFRARAGAGVKLSDDIDFNARLVTEPRYYIRPPSLDRQFIRDEALFDKLNFTWRNVLDLPLTIVAGRQELKFGSGWLIADATPVDGSRTGFFDALRLTHTLDTPDTTVDLVWVENHADTAKWLKPIGDKDEDLSEQDEKGAILYVARKTGKDAGIDGFFIYKRDHHRVVSKGYEGEIYTPGVRKYGRLDERWQYSTELAPQFGHKNGRILRAFAANNKLIYNYNDEKQNKICLGYEYLSGDDDKTKNFDRGWARIDSWSVLYQGGLDSIDGRAYDNSNLHRIYTGWETNPTEKTNLRCGYNLLLADDNTSSGGSGGLSKSGNFRGQLLSAMLKYKPSKTIEHRIEGEMFVPGDFYNKDKNDSAVFIRYGFYLTW